MSKRAIGIDIGGTNIRSGIVDGVDICCASENKTPDNFADFKKLIDKIVYLAKEKASEDLPVGIAIPGLIDQKNKTISFSPNLSFLDGKKFNQIYHNTVFGNDADMALIGELSSKEKDNTAFFSLGTGVGFAFYVQGKGSWELNNAGEAGHMKVITNGKKCGCGQKGCLEAYFSGTALLKEAKFKLSKNIDNVNEIFLSAKNGDINAIKIVDEASRILGIGIANIVNVLGIENIIIGGKLALSYDNFIHPVYLSARSNIFAFENRAFTISQSQLIDKAAIIGSANFALRNS